MNIILSGVYGRMGQAIEKLCESSDINIAAGVVRIAAGIDIYTKKGAAKPFPVYTSFADCEKDNIKADGVIDFSSTNALGDLLNYALNKSLPCVLATTGYANEDTAMIIEASARIPIFQSANMSLGIALLKELAKQAAFILGSSYDIEIIEKHHKHKKDAPSGTALLLYDAIKSQLEENNASKSITPIFGRKGMVGERSESEIGLHALRGGTVVGTHEVGFYGQDEIIELTHTATSRDIFATGALRAIGFLANQSPGLYSMDDLLKDLLNKI